MNPTDRDNKGRFARGNPGGPGRPRREVERQYLDAIAESCDAATWQRIVKRAIADAQDGDRYAREWLSRYLLPQHPDAIDFDDDDLADPFEGNDLG